MPRNARLVVENESVKYVDDATAASSIDLKKSLIKDPITRQKPLTLNEQCELILPVEKNSIQNQVYELAKFTKKNKMKINENKTKLIVFNPTRKWKFPPEVSFPGSENLEVVTQAKILGVTVSEDLKWGLNTENMVKKARKRLWILRRMRKLGLDNTVLKDVYIKEIRSVLEFAAPVWTGALIKNESKKIENVQKTVLKLILQNKYKDYITACEDLNLASLQKRREKLCLNFAKKNLKNRNSFFDKQLGKTRLRQQKIAKEFQCNTNRMYMSSLPFMSRLLNENARG